MPLVRRIVWPMLLALVAATGCEQPAPPVNTDDAAANLRSALQAWKDKQAYGSLAQQSPSVTFNEPLWRDGVTLLDFELGEVTLHGRQARCSAKLTLVDKDGKQYERKIGYQIDTTPVIVIVREGLGP